MDNLTHTMIGAALAATGLRRRSRYAAAVLMIGANIPDVDVLAIPLGHSVDWRRGVTHGVPALVLWPFLLTGLVLLWHRWIGRRRQLPSTAPPVRPRQLVLLSALAVLSHPFYDWLNNYGLRWLMPLDGTWFYGDAMYIVDPWLLLLLIGGTVLTRRRIRAGRPHAWRPARVAVGAGAAYTASLLLLHEVAEERVQRWLVATGAPAAPMEASPTFANPAVWRVIVERDGHYERGRLSLLAPERPPAIDLRVPVNRETPWAEEARNHPDAAGFLDWARWPRYERDSVAGVVTILDLRYAAQPGGGWATVTVPAGGGGRAAAGGPRGEPSARARRVGG